MLGLSMCKTYSMFEISSFTANIKSSIGLWNPRSDGTQLTPTNSLVLNIIYILQMMTFLQYNFLIFFLKLSIILEKLFLAIFLQFFQILKLLTNQLFVAYFAQTLSYKPPAKIITGYQFGAIRPSKSSSN